MATPPTPAEDLHGWTPRPTMGKSGNDRYTHPQYAGWEIYDAGPGAVITLYNGGANTATYASVAAAIEEITENVVPDNRRVDLDGNLIRRRTSIPAVDHERYVRGIAEILDPSAFDASDPSGDGPSGQHRRDIARQTAREVLTATGTPEPTPEPDRVVAEDTVRTFVIEHEAWYAEEVFARRPERVLAAISVETDTAAWELTWKNVAARVNPDRPHESGLTAMQLAVLDDAWEAFALSGFDEVMSAVMLGRLDGGTPTPQEVAAVLTRLGWTDATQYATPDIYRTAAHS